MTKKSTSSDTGRQLRTAFFPGSFRPFTIGHDSLVRRGLNIFDRIIIGIGINSQKTSDADEASSIADSIRRIYHAEPRVEVIIYDGLTADAAAKAGASALLRGVRSLADFEYERNLADINRQLSGIETVLLYSLPELAAVSSSVVRELSSYGRDISSFLPQPIEE